MNINSYIEYSSQIHPSFPAIAEKMSAVSDALMNAKLNVTAIRDGDGILAKHIIDSLYAAKRDHHS